MEPINGVVRVPDAPGLGLELDREELKRSSALPPKRILKNFIVRSRFKNGAVMLTCTSVGAQYLKQTWQIAVYLDDWVMCPVFQARVLLDFVGEKSD